jgi:serine/threonine protein kinase
MDQLKLFVDLVLHQRYKITRQLGRGGMGAVYEATDLQQKRQVAIKQMLPVDPSLRLAFKREATILSQINHPGLPHAIDYFENETGLFMAMEFIPGENLGELLAGRGVPFAPHQVKRWAEDILQILNFLHTQNPRVIHRDIKPANLKLTPQGKIVLLDFGLAKEVHEDDELITNICMLAYTPHYAPLEQIQGESTNSYSDIYALGATLYHLLTGSAPTDALKRANNILCKNRDPLPQIAHLIQGVPQSLSSLVMKALSLTPADRPTSASQMLQQLQAGIIAPSFRTAANTFAQATQSEPVEARLEATYGYPASPEATLVNNQARAAAEATTALPSESNSSRAQYPHLKVVPKRNQISVSFPQRPVHVSPPWLVNHQQTQLGANAELHQLRFTNAQLHTANANLLSQAHSAHRTANTLLVLLCIALASIVFYRSSFNPLQLHETDRDLHSQTPADSREAESNRPLKSTPRRASQTPAVFIESDPQTETLTIEDLVRDQMFRQKLERAKRNGKRLRLQPPIDQVPPTSL